MAQQTEEQIRTQMMISQLQSNIRKKTKQRYIKEPKKNEI